MIPNIDFKVTVFFSVKYLENYNDRTSYVTIIIISPVILDQKDFCDAERDLLAIAKFLVT